MSMNFAAYVGPYIKIDRSVDFDYERWESTITPGMGELGVNLPYYVLIPNFSGLGCHVDDTMEALVEVSPATIVREKVELSRRAAEFIQFCLANNIEWEEGWGIVPRWS